MAIAEIYARVRDDLERSSRASFFGYTGSPCIGAVEAADVVQNVFLEALEQRFQLPPTDEITERFIRKRTRWRTVDAIRSEATDNIRLDGMALEGGFEWNDLPGPPRVRRGTALSDCSAEDEYFARMPDAGPSEAIHVAIAAHADIDEGFTIRARDRLANSQRRALRAGFRPLVVEVLLLRRSLLSTLLQPGARDTYRGATAEAKLIASRTGLCLGRSRNLRTEVIRVLRDELHEEIEIALDQLARLWKVTREEAVQVHLRLFNGITK